MSLCGIVFVMLFLMVGPNETFDYETLLISLTILCFFVSIIKFSNGHLFTQNVLMVCFFLVYIIPRLIVYLVFPEIIVFPFESIVNVYQINTALLYMLVGSVCIFVGFIVAKNIFKLFISPANSYPEPVVYNFAAIFAVFLTAMISAWYVQEIMRVSHLSRVGGHNVLAQLLLVVFNVDLVFFMGCATLLFKRSIDKKSIFSAAFITAIYFVYFTVNGSRGTALRIVTLIIVILLCKIGNFKIQFKYVIVISLFLFLSYGLFAFATQKRIDKVKKYLPESVAEGSFYEDNVKKSKELFSKVTSRLGLIDNAIIILSRDAEPSAKSKYMNMSYAGKNIANLILPGVVFKDAEMNTSRVIPVLYGVLSDDYLEGGGYYSDFYTPWGIFFLIFGWWTGWFMLLVAGMGIHFLYLFMMRFGGKYRYHAGALCLATFSQLFYSNMGIDHWIANSIMIFGSGIITLILFKSIEFIFLRLFRRKVHYNHGV